MHAPVVTTGRDLRLDLFRGLALWLIFLDHIPSNVVAWGTIRNYGLSDASEIFIFISGYTASLVYGRAIQQHGFVIAAARILRALDLPVEIDGKHVFPRASVGICLVGEDVDTPAAAELLRNADVAMYMAKRDSKGSYRVFEPAMHERVLARLELRADLQRAIDEDELEVHYQPVVRLDGRVMYGVEALLRWTHPTRGNIPPLQFIPLAEETGLIIPIGRWVLGAACREGVVIHERFAREDPLTISVNLSVRQLQSDTIVADVRDALEASGLPASSLVLEITESVMMADTELAVSRLGDLKALGVRLAMDDFGTGYSSLSYLGRFPVDILKMDRSFLASGENDSLAAAVIALGASLALDVVAEGIEYPEQASSLRELGCELGQGFLFARPMAHDALHEYLEVDDASDACARDAETELPKRALDGLALRVEDALLGPDEDSRLHVSTTSGSASYARNEISVSRSNASR